MMPGLPATNLVRLLACFLALVAVTPASWAQNTPRGDAAESGADGGGGGGGGGGVPSAIDIEVDAFGVGGVIRPGGWAGVRLVLTDTAGSSPRAVAVRLHVPDPDGDTLLVQREITLTPGRRMATWIYTPVPWTLPRFFTVTVHELSDSGPDNTEVGDQLSARRVTAQTVREPDTGFIGVVGSRLYALDQYELTMEQGAQYAAQEWLDVVPGLAPEDLPDRWEGLQQYDILVWGDADPTRLGLERPAAIEEWVRRGGHLVIVMQPVGGVWFTNDDPLASIMPRVRSVRVEGVSYEPYRALLTTEDNDDVPLPSGATVHSFERPTTVEPRDAVPLISGPHGNVVTRRLVGSGMVTVVGFDLGDPDFLQRRIMRADTLWHRLLGKSLPIPFPDPQGRGTRLGRSSPAEGLADRHFAGSIENTAQAGVGILLAVVIFMAYWLVAGPLGFGVLKLKHWQRHAWVVFLATVGVFGVIAWMGAQTLKDDDVRATHLTFLDHVHGTSFQTTRTYAGVMVPGYGDRTIALAEGAVDADSRNLLAVWSDPAGSGLRARFPDARSYVHAVRDPSTLRSPVRSTVKTVRADWAGGVVWKTPRPAARGREPRLTDRNTLEGLLRHDLPAALTDVKIVLCHGQREPEYRPREGDEFQQQTGVYYPRVRVWELREAWEPGADLDLDTVTTEGRPTLGGVYFRNLVPNANTARSMGPTQTRTPYSWSQARVDAERLTWRPLLVSPGLSNLQWERDRVVTRAGHGLDLARFMTMPCVVVTGHIRSDAGPTPLRIGGAEGRRIPMEGHTMVRWIYPLTPDPVFYGPAR